MLHGRRLGYRVITSSAVAGLYVFWNTMSSMRAFWECGEMELSKRMQWDGKACHAMDRFCGAGLPDTTESRTRASTISEDELEQWISARTTTYMKRAPFAIGTPPPSPEPRSGSANRDKGGEAADWIRETRGRGRGAREGGAHAARPRRPMSVGGYSSSRRVDWRVDRGRYRPAEAVNTAIGGPGRSKLPTEFNPGGMHSSATTAAAFPQWWIRMNGKLESELHDLVH